MSKRKKLSLEEARALFSGPEKKSPKSSYRSKAKKPRMNMNTQSVGRRIEMLERKIMEGDLSNEEEAQIMKEIGNLERKL